MNAIQNLLLKIFDSQYEIRKTENNSICKLCKLTNIDMLSPYPYTALPKEASLIKSTRIK